MRIALREWREPRGIGSTYPPWIRADNFLKEVIRELRREAGLKSSDD